MSDQDLCRSASKTSKRLSCIYVEHLHRTINDLNHQITLLENRVRKLQRKVGALLIIEKALDNGGEN